MVDRSHISDDEVGFQGMGFKGSEFKGAEFWLTDHHTVPVHRLHIRCRLTIILYRYIDHTFVVD